MDRPRLIRGLRIAWSVWWAVLCVLLVVFWVISRSRYSGIEGHVGKQTFSVVSSFGQINIYLFSTKAVPTLPWRFNDSAMVAGEGVMPGPGGVQINPNDAGLGVFVSYWVLVPLAAVLTAAPWLPWRFSLRTLLIATTLIAVGLGLIVFLTKAPTAPPVDVGDFPADF